MKKTLFITALIILFSCSKDEDVVIPLSSENYILDFKLQVNEEVLSGIINDTNNTISFNSINLKIENAIPKITISAKSTISPRSGQAQNFSFPVSYQVAAEDGSIKTYQVIVNNKNLSEENKIVTFGLLLNNELKKGVIDETEKIIKFDVAGAILKGLVPTVQISNGATISPSLNSPQDFNEEVAYTVISEDGTPAVYRVLVNNRPLSSENQILKFAISDVIVSQDAIVNNETQIISFDFGNRDRTSLIPEITISEYASIVPSAGIAQDFTNPVIYIVTAEDGSKTEYKVIANLPKIDRVGGNNFSAMFFVGANLFISGKFLDTSISGAELYLYDGINKYPLNIVTTENYDVEDIFITVFNIYTTIPESTPTFSQYQVVYENDGEKIFSEFSVDIQQENAPLPLTVDKDKYVYNDELIIIGENLTTSIAIPAPNGSVYVINPGYYDISINSEATEMRVVLKLREFFPSYYGQDERLTEILIFGEGGRRARSIKANFH